MSSIREFPVAKPSRFPTDAPNCATQDMSIRIKNGVAVISGCSSSMSIRRDTARAVSKVEGVDQVIDLVNEACC